MPTKITLAKAVRHFRVTNGLSIEKAATAAGIRKLTWLQLEQGRSNPRLSTLEAIAFTLGVPVQALFGQLWPNLETLKDLPNETTTCPS